MLTYAEPVKRAGPHKMLYEISYRMSGPRKGQLKVVLDELTPAMAREVAELLNVQNNFEGVIRSCERDFGSTSDAMLEPKP